VDKFNNDEILFSIDYNLGPKSSDEEFMREPLRHPMFELILQAK